MCMFYSMSSKIKVLKDRTSDEKVRRFLTDIARESVLEWGERSETAKTIQRKLEETFSGKWMCIVGTSYTTSSIYYTRGNLLNIQIGDIDVLMYQSDE